MKSTVVRLGVLVFLGVLFAPLAARAFELRGGEEVSIDEGETISEDAYIGAGMLEVSGLVQGDLSAAGGQVDIDGEVTADLMVAGGDINISGTVGDDLKTVGGDTVVSGSVAGDYSAAGGAIHLDDDAVIGGDVLIAGGDVDIVGTVEGSITIAGGNVVLNGPVAGDVNVRAGNVEVGPGADIGGSLVYRAEREADIAEGAVIAGEIEFEEIGGGGVLAAILTSAVLGSIMLLAGAMLFGLVFARFTGGFVERAMSGAWWRYLLLGFAIIVLVPVAAILLFFTVIGAPLGLLMLLGYVGFLIFAWFYAAILLGSLIMSWARKDRDRSVTWLSILVGALAYVIIGLIPYVGWIIQAGLFFTAIGALGSVKWNRIKQER